MTVEGAKKAWETRKKRQILIKEDNQVQEKQYDLPLKNKFRKKVIDFFDKDKTTLALESPEFLFVDALPTCNFILFEHDYENYKKLVCGDRKNILHIFNTDVSLVRFLNEDINQAYLDFCCTLETAIPSLVDAYSKLENCKKIALTFCLRGNKKEIEDYKFDLLKKIQQVFENFKLEYATSYRDGAPMVGLLLSRRTNPSELVPEKPKWIKRMELDVFLWCEDYCRRTWGIKLFEGIIRTWANWNSHYIDNYDKLKELWIKMPAHLKNNVLLSYRTKYEGLEDIGRYSKNLGDPDKHMDDYLVYMLHGFWMDHIKEYEKNPHGNPPQDPYYFLYEKKPECETIFGFNFKEINDAFLKKCVEEYRDHHKGEF